MRFLKIGPQIRINMKNVLAFTACLWLPYIGLAQEDIDRSLKKEWHHQTSPNGSLGVSTDEALAALSDVEPEEIVIAIIDSGVDTTHSDLKSQLWINEDEIPGNGIDDDGNGYVDDIHGWNFIGGPNGNIEGETMELTRLYVSYLKKWEGLSQDSIMEASPQQYANFITLQQDLKSQQRENRMEQIFMTRYKREYETYREKVELLLGADFSDDQLDSLARSSHKSAQAAQVLRDLHADGLDAQFFEEYGEQLDSYLNFYLNEEWDIRDSIVGDDPNDWNDTIYGNNDLMGLSSDHGTHVAGIVGAARNNGIGIDGITPRVKLMILRVVPNGDERDKDVALAIKYAVRNGASIINMSFGKDYSPDAAQVQAVCKWAQDRDVLLVHAAGNDGQNLDYGENYPYMPYEENNLENEAWIEVGASTLYAESLAADFSNYGEASVDLFAPGEDIYSTLPVDTYGFNSGTSMAAPVVTGVAGIIRSYYPELTAAQVKTILIESVVKSDARNFRGMSITNGVVNALEAINYIESNKESLGID